jgi:hypothetical protein
VLFTIEKDGEQKHVAFQAMLPDPLEDWRA